MNSDLTSFDKIEQKIGGSRKISNYIIGGMLTIGGIGFLLASISSYTGRDLLPLIPSCVARYRGQKKTNTSYRQHSSNNII